MGEPPGDALIEPDIRKQIQYHLDKGLTRRMLFDEMARQYACDSTCDHPHNMDDVGVEFQAMVEDGTLTVGRLHGSDDFVVVTDWMPNSAQQMRDADKPVEEDLDDEAPYDVEDQHDPAELAEALKFLGVLPENATEAWITGHTMNFGDSDVVQVKEVTFGPARVGRVGMSYGRKPQDP